MPVLTLKKTRPVWYNLSPVNLPVPGLVSIFHRISGVLLFVGLFWLLYLLEASLSSPDSYETFRSVASHPVSKLFLIVFAWAYLHHLCAGIRYLGIDMHKAEHLQGARATAMTVLAVSLLLTLVVAVKIW